MSEERNPYQPGIGQSCKNHPGVVATGIIGGALVGGTTGLAVSQLAGTPVVPSVAIGAGAGAVVGGGVGVYAAVKLDAAEAGGVLAADIMISERLGQPRRSKANEIADAFVDSLIEKAPQFAQAIQNGPNGKKTKAATAQA